MLGIGIITYKRKMLLQLCIDHVRENTKEDYVLLVADDGSNDGSVELCRQLGIPVITGKNKGVCWNKNRALYTLNLLGADPIIILEDDCWPVQQDWAGNWIETIAKWQHLNYKHPYWPAGWCKGGSGTIDDPWRSWELTGQCTGTTAAALNKVGYLNTKFWGYGFGHIEWSERFCKAKYLNRHIMPCSDYGLKLQKAGTYCNNAQIKYNNRVFHELARKPFAFCEPWKNDEEKGIFKNEIEQALKTL